MTYKRQREVLFGLSVIHIKSNFHIFKGHGMNMLVCQLPVVSPFFVTVFNFDEWWNLSIKRASTRKKNAETGFDF